MTNQNPRTVSLLDIIIIVCLLAGACAFWPFAASLGRETVAVYRDNRSIARYPISPDRIFPVRGSSGTMILRIHANSVRVAESSCPKGICVRAGAIGRVGQQIVCAPNHILVEIETSSQTPIDAVTQ